MFELTIEKQLYGNKKCWNQLGLTIRLNAPYPDTFLHIKCRYFTKMQLKPKVIQAS